LAVGTFGIDASAKSAAARAQITRIAQGTAGLLDLGRELRPDEIELDERHHEGVYGVPGEGTLAAMRLAGRLSVIMEEAA
jgi:1-aminocyclopropane-1-carboxylate deaminase